MSSHLTEPALSGSGGTATTRWDGRIARARELSAQYPSASQILTFYAGLAEYQRLLCLHSAPGRGASEFIDSVDLDAASAAAPDFLDWLQHTAPAPLAGAATSARTLTCADWRDLMHETLQGLPFDPSRASGSSRARSSDDELGVDAGDLEGRESGTDEATTFVVEALLQPVAEAGAICRRDDLLLQRPASSGHASRCPICGGAPCVGVLREAGHGARRMLACAVCLSEWEFLRVVCPACEEQRFDALPVYTSDAFPHVRIEACDTCRRYMKTIDLTKNGLAVPLVDDFATVPLDLWARDQGYRRIRENLLRT